MAPAQALNVLINQFRIGPTVSGLVALLRDPIVFAIFTAAIFRLCVFCTLLIYVCVSQTDS